MIKSLIVGVLMLFSATVPAAWFQVANDGPVTGYFAGSTAGYSSFMNAKFSDPSIDNPYVSNRVAIGTQYDWGVHEAGSTVVFALRVMDINEWFYSIPSYNDDGINHIYYQAFTDMNGVPSLYVGFEDLYGGGDLDFNDNSIIFSNIVVVGEIPPVPEPETYAMLLIGLGLVGFTAYRRGGGGGFVKDNTIPGI